MQAIPAIAIGAATLGVMLLVYWIATEWRKFSKEYDARQRKKTQIYFYDISGRKKA